MALQTLSGFAISAISILFAGLLAMGPALAGALGCQEDPASLDTKVVDEASGLALAPGGGFFVMNDSGDKPRFFKVNSEGRDLVEFGVTGWKPFDPEAIRVGPCPATMPGQCLAVADIGDNRDRRKFVEVAFFATDRLKTPSTLKPDRILRFHYPDGPRNAEGFAVLSNSQLLVITKEQDRKSRAAKPARVYTVAIAGSGSVLTETTAIFQAAWDVPDWVKDHGLGGLVTDVDATNVTKERLRVLILTYSRVVEVEASWTLGRMMMDNKRIYRIDSMEQQEAISYDDQKRGFYFTSEAPLAGLSWLTAGERARMPIRYVRPEACGDRLR
ncbi:MAG: hypothetical protein JNJ49_06605 [Bdellovibrionaceae bacterium]|nr:hypothetical protein [Pseudobdellovibrionaceae bacterium]